PTWCASSKPSTGCTRSTTCSEVPAWSRRGGRASVGRWARSSRRRCSWPEATVPPDRTVLPDSTVLPDRALLPDRTVPPDVTVQPAPATRSLGEECNGGLDAPICLTREPTYDRH